MTSSKQIGKMNFLSSILLIAALASGSILIISAVDPVRLKSLESLYRVAVFLDKSEAPAPAETEAESKAAPTRARAQEGPSRFDYLIGFARESKSYHCEIYRGQVLRDIEEYRDKAMSFNQMDRNSNGWLSKISSSLFSPLNRMKALSKSYSYLQPITDRYEREKVASEELDCHLRKFNVSAIHTMLFVLQTEIKLLIIEEPRALGIAIYNQLREDNFWANHDFFGVSRLNPAQQLHLLSYYAEHVDQNKVKIREALTHYYTVGNLIIGRLLDACTTLNRYLDEWSELDATRPEVCNKSDENYGNEFKRSAYDRTFKLCQGLIDNF